MATLLVELTGADVPSRVDAADLSDLLYGIDDGACDAQMRVVPNPSVVLNPEEVAILTELLDRQVARGKATGAEMLILSKLQG